LRIGKALSLFCSQNVRKDGEGRKVRNVRLKVRTKLWSCGEVECGAANVVGSSWMPGLGDAR